MRAPTDICLECGEEIPERRLRAPPFAIRCKDCEEALEVEERVGDRRLDGSSSGGGDNHDCFSSF
jgi:RNA polymerase-binding transcription factor DksA